MHEPQPPAAFVPRRVEKPWGYELIWAHCERYAGKLLHINAGESLSLQFHHFKEETLHVLAGRIHLEVCSDGVTSTLELFEGECFHIPPGMIHRIWAVEPADVLEASSPELDDVVRISDRYGRETVREPMARGV